MIRMENGINQLLFWAHVALIVSFPAIGWKAGPLVMLAIIIAHRAHVMLLGECALSKIQRKTGGLPHGMTFLQLVSSRLLKMEWSMRQAQWADYSIVAVAFLVSCTRI